MSTNDYGYRLLEEEELSEDSETPKASAVEGEAEEEKEEEVTL